MPAPEASLEVQVGLGPEADAEELEELTIRLRRELLELEVESVERARGAPPPPGARAGEVVSFGTLLVTLATTPELLGAVVSTVQRWLSRVRGGRSVRVKLGDDELEISGASSAQQERLIMDWIARHAVG